jgi:hypothetical protein
MRWLGGRRRRTVVIVVALVFLVVVEGRLFVFPPVDAATRADAIVVFNGPGERHSYGRDLADRDGRAPTVVISIPDTDLCRPWNPEIEHYCLTPDPAMTRGEARAFAELARERGWDHVIVVSTASQSVRTRVRLTRCYDGEAQYVTMREGFWAQAYRVIYENGAMVRALLFERDC